MTARETVALYYDAWQNKQGDLGDVPQADAFQFIGPVASFDSAGGIGRWRAPPGGLSHAQGSRLKSSATPAESALTAERPRHC